MHGEAILNHLPWICSNFTILLLIFPFFTGKYYRRIARAVDWCCPCFSRWAFISYGSQIASRFFMTSRDHSLLILTINHFFRLKYASVLSQKGYIYICMHVFHSNFMNCFVLIKSRPKYKTTESDDGRGRRFIIHQRRRMKFQDNIMTSNHCNMRLWFNKLSGIQEKGWWRSWKGRSGGCFQVSWHMVPTGCERSSSGCMFWYRKLILEMDCWSAEKEVLTLWE